MTKVCIKCNVEMPLEDFAKATRRKDGRQSHCKKCDNIRVLESRIRHSETRASYLFKNKEKAKIQRKVLYNTKKEEILSQCKLYRLRNNEVISLKSKIKYQIHKEEINKHRNKKHRERLLVDMDYRLRTRIRSRVKDILKKKRIKKPKNCSAINDLGCSIPEFRSYIEAKFQPGMNWENYGIGRNKWTLDHIIPLSSFDLTIPEQFRKACRYNNLQPLWFIENVKKAAKIAA